MPRKLLLIPSILILLALACGPNLPTTQPPVTEEAPIATEVVEVLPTEPPAGQAFVPNVSVGEAGTQPESAPQEGTQEDSATTPDPHVEVEASVAALKVGESLTVTGKPVGIGLPYYYLIVRDEGVQDTPPMVQITYENQATLMEGSSQFLEFVSAEGGMESVTFVLKAKAPGVATVMINATGEVPRPDGAAWGGEGSGLILITVNP